MPPIARKIVVDPRYPEKQWQTNDAGQWFQQRLNWKDPIFQVAATTINYDITGFPAGTAIVGAFLRNGVNWTGGAIATATLSLGTTASPATYIAATSVFSGSPKTVQQAATMLTGTFINAANPLSAGTIRAQLILTGANGSALLTGWCDVFIGIQAFKLTA